MLSFSSSGFLLGFNKGGLAVWNQLTAVQDIGLEWALSLQRDEQWKVNYRHLQWSFWRSSESFDGMPCRKLTLSFLALLLWVSRDCQSLGLSCQKLLTPRVSAAPPHPYMDRSANFLGGEFPFTALSSRKECCSFGMKSQSESSAAWNDIPYVLNLQSPDVPRNECDDDFVRFRVICGSPAWSWVGIVSWQAASLAMRGLFC